MSRIIPDAEPMNERLTVATCLPKDQSGRCWSAERAACSRRAGVSRFARTAPTSVEGRDRERVLRARRSARRDGRRPTAAAAAGETLANSASNRRNGGAPWLLAPCDLQAIKASGVTFVSSMLERVIEEQARGDPTKAESVRNAIVAVIGDDLARVRPGSPEAAR
jgi:fumarylacetoacetate (FAA) hydrolase family protein